MTESKEYLLVEYQATQESYLHHDGFPWQVGGLLIAGVFVFWGFILDKQLMPDVVVVSSVVVTLLMSAWILYAHHVRQIYLYKLDRIREIERELGMEQHRRFVPAESSIKHYIVFGPSGFYLNLAIYMVVSWGGLALWGIQEKKWSNLLVIPIVLVIAVLLWIYINERRMNSVLDKESGQPSPSGEPDAT